MRKPKHLLTPVSSHIHTDRYMEAIRQMCSQNLTSLEVHYSVLKAEHPTLALWLMDAPEDILTVFDEVCALLSFPCSAAAFGSGVGVWLVCSAAVIVLWLRRVCTIMYSPPPAHTHPHTSIPLQVANEVVLRRFRHYKNMLKGDTVHVRIVGHDIVLSLRTLRQVSTDGRKSGGEDGCVSSTRTHPTAQPHMNTNAFSLAFTHTSLQTHTTR